jgi:hypothetical protein
MTQLSMNDSRCEALFVSGLQRSDAPAAEAVAEAISRTVRRYGVSGCAGRMAQEFGDHPEAAAVRMRWVRQLVREMLPTPATVRGMGCNSQIAEIRRLSRRPASSYPRCSCRKPRMPRWELSSARVVAMFWFRRGCVAGSSSQVCHLRHDDRLCCCDWSTSA